MNVKIKSLPQEEMPRERLLMHGAKTLSNSELLAILLRTGTTNKSAIGLAAELLSTTGGLERLGKVSATELCTIKGIGDGKACQLLASFELARRLNYAPQALRQKFKSPEDVFKYVIDTLKFEDREHFLVVGLNTKNVIIGRHLVSIGTLNQTLVHPREVFNWAIKNRCASVVIVHNHPSGFVEPSREDLMLTERIVEAGKIIGIKVLDHIIVSADSYYSLKSNGKI